MPSLCSNRFEPFGPYSTIHPSIPTQCFDDIILIPLATWIYLPLIILAFLSSRRTSRYTSGLRPSRDVLGRGVLQRTFVGFYFVLIIAMLAMVSLEIARLTTAQLGIGLLPFSYVGIVLAFLVHILTAEVSKGSSRRRLLFRGCNAVYWIMLLLFMAIKAAGAKMEENSGYIRTGQQAQYPVDDSWVDNLTMVCVELVLAGLEFITP